MQQHSSRTYFLISGAIAAGLLGIDLVRLVTTRRLPAGQLHNIAVTAAALFAGVGMINRHTCAILELARRLERARLAVVPEPGSVPGQPQVAGQSPRLRRARSVVGQGQLKRAP